MSEGDFYDAVADVLRAARAKAQRAVNFAMVEAYWNVGRMIVEEEQAGEQRAEYGAFLVKELSRRLTEDFGRGFGEKSLWNMRLFYQTFPILSAVRRELTWTHYRVLMRVSNSRAREWYMNEAAEQNWSTRALERQIHSLYFERMRLTDDRSTVEQEMKKNTAPLAARPGDLIKDPYVLEFLGLPDPHIFRESELEQAIIDKLQAFMLELGRGFAFVGRQQRISTETSEFYIDLVFYNYILKCFVLIDLKTGKLTHQDIGQMDMYVRMYEDKVKGADDNPTVWLILCAEKDQTVVKYSVLDDDRQLFAARYYAYLPTEQELIDEIERGRDNGVREAVPLYALSHMHLNQRIAGAR